MARTGLSYYSFDSLGNPWVSGGGAVRDFEVLRRFARHTRVTLTVGKYPGFQPGLRDGIEFRGLGFGGNNWICRISFALLANFRVLYDRADILGFSPSIYAPVLTGLLRRRKAYWVMHHTVGNQSFRKYGPLALLPFLWEQLFLRCGRTYFVSNRSLRDRIARVNPKARVELTTNGFDPALLALESKVSAPPYILFLGRFDVYMKGLDLLIRAFAEVAAVRGIELVLAGRASPSAVDQVCKLIPESLVAKVRIALNISESQKAELLSGCLFFCSPSRFEGFGIAALEANAAGKAALVTDADGFRDSLALGETALAVPCENQQALNDGLSRMLNDPELCARLGQRGRERARAFSWDAIAAQEWDWLSRLREFANTR